MFLPTKRELDYVYKPLVWTDELREMADNRPNEFLTKYFPKLVWFCDRRDFAWISQVMCYSNEDEYRTFTTKRLRTYNKGGGSKWRHNGTDITGNTETWQLEDANLLYNPFPKGCVVECSSQYDSQDDEGSLQNSRGNVMKLRCYLDGDVENKDNRNFVEVEFIHNKQHSNRLRKYERVEFGQVVAQTGGSGMSSTKLYSIHVHVYISWRGYTLLDPFFDWDYRDRWNKKPFSGGNFMEKKEAGIGYDYAWVFDQKAFNKKPMFIDHEFITNIFQFRGTGSFNKPDYYKEMPDAPTFLSYVYQKGGYKRFLTEVDKKCELYFESADLTFADMECIWTPKDYRSVGFVSDLKQNLDEGGWEKVISNKKSLENEKGIKVDFNPQNLEKGLYGFQMIGISSKQNIKRSNVVWVLVK